MSLAYFENVGRATPSATFQTAVWATMNDDKTVLASVVSLTSDAQKKAAAFLTRLPVGTQHEYPNPESLGALVVANQVLRGTAFEVLGATAEDVSHAVLRLRVTRGDTTSNTFTFEIPMQRGPNGWQIVVTAQAINSITAGNAETISAKH